MPRPASFPPVPSRPPAPPAPPPRGTLTVFRLAALTTLLAVAMGAVVCATTSGASCPTWPGCRPDQLAPQWQASPVIEFTHRVVAVCAGPLVLASALLSLRLPAAGRWIRALPWVALGCAVASGAFGRLVVLSTLPTWLGAVDLCCALTAMTATGVAAVLLAAPAGRRRVGEGSTRPDPTVVTRRAGGSVAVLLVMHVTGIFAAGTGSYTRCLGWPLPRTPAADPHPWLQGARLGLAGLGAVLVVGTAVAAWRGDRLHRLRPWGAAVAALPAAETLLGFAVRTRGPDDGVAAAHSVVAVALLSGLGLLAAVASRGAATGSPTSAPRPPAATGIR